MYSSALCLIMQAKKASTKAWLGRIATNKEKEIGRVSLAVVKKYDCDCVWHNNIP